MLRLKSGEREQRWTLEEDIRQWLPGEDQLVRAELPLELPRGSYAFSLGIDTGVPELGMLCLAVEGREADGFYALGDIEAQ